MARRKPVIRDPFGGEVRPVLASARSALAIGGVLLLLVLGVVGGVWWLQQDRGGTPGATTSSPAGGVAFVGNTENLATGVFQENGRMFREYGREYDDVGGLFSGGFAEVGGEVAYTARRGQSFFVVHRGNVVGQSLSDLGGILSLVDNAGTPAFIAMRSDLSALGGFGGIIYANGQRWDTPYAYVRELTSINGKLAYVGITQDQSRTNGQRAVVAYDGKEYGAKYDNVEMPFALEGKLAFFATRGGDLVVVVVADGKETELLESQFEGGEVKDSSGRVVQLFDNGTSRWQTIFNGKTVTVDWGTDRSFAWYDGQKLGAEFDDVLEAAPVGNKLALLVRKNGKTLIAYDGKEYGLRYDGIYDTPGTKNDAYSLRVPFRMGPSNIPDSSFTAIKFIGDVGGKLTYLVTVEYTADGVPKNIIVKEE